MLQAIIDILECTYLWEHLIIRDNMSKLTFNVLRIENINGRGENDGISIPIQVISEFMLEYVDDDSNRAYTHCSVIWNNSKRCQLESLPIHKDFS